MTSAYATLVAATIMSFGVRPIVAQSGSCAATPSSMTPVGWVAPATRPSTGPRGPLRQVADVLLPGPANRFDYQSVDPAARRLYVNHMNAGRLVVFDLDSSRVLADIGGVDRATGVLAVPSQHRVYVSAAGRHELVAFDDRTLKIAGRVGGIRFPDGVAYAPVERRVFVSDEAGEADVVVDALTNRKRATIPLGGEAGNTHYDSVSHCIVVAVQTRNQLVAIDPATERVVARYDLAGSDHPHGFAIDELGRLAFVTGEGNATLQVVDLRTMHVLSSHRVGEDPDVVAWDPEWRRLYVASESGVVSVFAVQGAVLQPLEELRIPHAHTVAVDPRTHRVYLPLENLGGRPVLRILQPAPALGVRLEPAPRDAAMRDAILRATERTHLAGHHIPYPSVFPNRGKDAMMGVRFRRPVRRTPHTNPAHVLRRFAFVLGFSSLTTPATAQSPRVRHPVSADTQRVVFVCEHGSVKSMIAANLFNRMAAERGLAARAVSRGKSPDRAVPEMVRSGLRADGIDIGNQSPVHLDTIDARGTNMFVAFEVEIPADVSKRVEVRRWDGTPAFKGSYSEGRSAIAANVTQLIEELARSRRAKSRSGAQPHAHP